MDFTQILSRGTVRNMLVGAPFILVSGVHAATLDLAGVGTNITDVAELAGYDCVTNSVGGDPVTLTFNNSGSISQEYAGVISGNIRLVKDGGKSKLKLSGANTYTGGTLVQNGVIIVGNATACGDPGTTVEIDHFTSKETSPTGPWCSLQFDVSGFANPISLPAGTAAPSWSGNTYINHSLCVTNTGISVESPISGGFFAFLAAQQFATTGGGTVNNVTFNGPVTCTGMKVYSNGNVHFRGAVTNSKANISGAVHAYTPYFRFYSPDNKFNGTSFEFQQAYLSAEADNVFDGIDRVQFSRNDRNSCFYLKGHAVTIGRVRCASATAVALADLQIVDGGSGNHSVLTMKGGDDTISNLRFKNNMTLVWDPTGDCTFTATSNRTSTLKGPLVVKGGTFELDGGHTMLNLTNIVVKSGATLKVSSADVPFSSSVMIEAEPGATLNLAADITAATVKVGDHYLSAKGFSAGTYKGLTIAGAGSLVVSSKPGGEDTYTWTGGGADDNITTTNNWQNSDMPDFDDEAPFIVFAGGTAAVLDRDISASGVTFDGVTAFNLSASGNHVLSLGAGGLSNAPAASARAVTVSAPVMPLVDQVWQMETNTTFTLSGVLKKYGTSAPTITVRQSSYADPTINFIGAATAEGASDFAGDIVFEETALANGKYGTACVRASGYEPFGPDGKLKLMGSEAGHGNVRTPYLYLSNAVISKAVQYGPYNSTYYCADDNTTNVMNGAFTPTRRGTGAGLNGGTFPPKFQVGTNAVLRLCGDLDFGDRTTANDADVHLFSSSSAIATKPTGKVVFDGRITKLPLRLKLDNAVGLELNASENAITNLYLRHVDSLPTGVASPIIRFGTSYALSNGLAMVTFPTWIAASVDFDLNGTLQHVKGFAAKGRSDSPGARGCRILSSGGPGTLRISQPNDVVFEGSVETNVTIQMEGAATLTFSHETAFKAGSTLAVSNGTVAVSSASALNEDVSLKLMGGTISIPEGQTALVGETFYLDANGDLKPLPRGSYGPGDGKVGAFFASGSGSIRVKKGPGLGFVLIYR